MIIKKTMKQIKKTLNWNKQKWNRGFKKKVLQKKGKK